MSEPDAALLSPWTGPLGAPPFDAVRTDDFLPAFDYAIAAHAGEVARIADDPALPDFANTIAALERSGEPLARVRRLFWALSSARSDAGLRAIEGEVSERLSRHSAAISHNGALYARIAAVPTDGLTAEQARLTGNVRRGFVRGGAALAAADKLRLGDIDARLGQLSVAFGQNVLAATRGWSMRLGADDLDGLPEATRMAARDGDAWVFTADRGDYETFLTFSTRRDLRERMWRGFTGRCDGGAHDNRPVIVEMVALRREKAALLGHPSYAAHALEDSMAKTPAAAEALLQRVWRPALHKARAEAAELQALIDAEGGGFALAAWDWRFYAERVRRERFALDGARVKAALTLAKVRQAAFDAAGRLYGLRFTRRADVAVYHADVEAWSVEDAGGAAVGLLYTDYPARPGKHGGAWMGSLRVQERLDGDTRPIVYTVANFARGAGGADSCLSLDEARTLFHEFGHALHALLSDVTYPSLAGTAVARDFVEFPSKFMEHWIVAPQVLRGLGVADDLIAAIGAAETYGQGFATVEFVAAALVDLALHASPDPVDDPVAFEAATLAALGTPPAIGPRHRLVHFTHVFDGGYAAAYYSYLWSEVLDADAFAAFKQAGDIFDPALAARMRDEVLARGDSRDPAASYAAFRGRAPDEAPLIRSRGLG